MNDTSNVAFDQDVVGARYLDRCTIPLIDNVAPLLDLAVDLDNLKAYLPNAAQDSCA